MTAIASLETALTPEPAGNHRAGALAVLVCMLAATLGLVAYITLVR